MIVRIRSLMSTPFARPPGRRGRLARFAPEWCALLSYAVFGAVVLFLRPGLEYGSLAEAVLCATVTGYAAGGMLLWIVPVGMMALSLSGERARGTAEPAIVAAHDHAAQAWGRFLFLILPWGRLLLYLSPLYVMIAMNDSLGTGGASDLVAFVTMSISAPKPAVLVLGWTLADYIGDLHVKITSPLVLLLRPLNDCSIAVFAAAVAYYISAHCRGTGRSLVLSYAVVSGSLLTVLSLDTWWVLNMASLVGPSLAGTLGMSDEWGLATYVGLAAILFSLRLWLAFWLVRKVARNFDAYLLADKA